MSAPADIDIAELERLVERATPGDWQWIVYDHSMASLGVGDNIGMGDPHVLTVAPCPACAERASPKEWKWGRCLTPSENDAALIAAAPAAIRSLIERVRMLEAALRDAGKQLRLCEIDYRTKADAVPSHPNASRDMSPMNQKADRIMRTAELCEKALTSAALKPGATGGEKADG